MLNFEVDFRVAKEQISGEIPVIVYSSGFKADISGGIPLISLK